MKFVFISDTHGRHEINMPEGDAVIHAGDISMRGDMWEIKRFLEWYNSLPYKHKVFIAGNHDWGFQRWPQEVRELLDKYPSIIYLENSSVTIEGFKIYGSPVQPWFHDWAFNVERGFDIQQVWAKIPQDTDILVTHGPILGFGDQCKHGERVGCEDLLEKVQEIKPKLFICGHIHEDYGVANLVHDNYGREYTKCINASILDERYYVMNDPIVIEL